MIFCQRCKDQCSSADTPEINRAFPAFTVMAGIAGILGTAVTGSLLLLPASMFTGYLADRYRCDSCGDEVPEDEPKYQLMEEMGDDFGGRRYQTLNKPNDSETASQKPQMKGSNPKPYSTVSTDFQESSPEPDMVKDDLQRQNPEEFVFDEITGKMSPNNSLPDPDNTGFNSEFFQNPDINPGEGFLPTVPSILDDDFLEPFPGLDETDISLEGDVNLDFEPDLPVEDPFS